MIVDSSALLAILNDEPDSPQFAEALARQPRVLISAATLLESTIAVGRARREILDELITEIAPTIVAVDEHHLVAARDAWERYGRGSGSPAKLNYGDCFSYAAAKVTGEPLLFKGEDFIHTDVEGAL